MEDLITSYKKDRREISGAITKLEKEAATYDKDDWRRDDCRGRANNLSWLIANLDYGIDWMEAGCKPGNKRGIERRAYYQRDIPAESWVLRKYMYGGNRGVTDAHTHITEEQVIMMEEALAILTVQQRDAFIMVKVNEYSLEMAAEIMGLKKTSVQNHVDRAKLKIAEFINKHSNQISLPITG